MVNDVEVNIDVLFYVKFAHKVLIDVAQADRFFLTQGALTGNLRLY